jgi:large subunit ribosomal protein L29
MEARDLRQDPDEALKEKAKKLREEIFNLHFKATTEPIDNPARIRDMRRDIARIETILHERVLKANPRPGKRSRTERKGAAMRKANATGLAAKKQARRTGLEKAAAKKRASKKAGTKSAAAAKKQG